MPKTFSKNIKRGKVWRRNQHEPKHHLPILTLWNTPSYHRFSLHIQLPTHIHRTLCPTLLLHTPLHHHNIKAGRTTICPHNERTHEEPAPDHTSPPFNVAGDQSHSLLINDSHRIALLNTNPEPDTSQDVRKPSTQDSKNLGG